MGEVGPPAAQMEMAIDARGSVDRHSGEMPSPARGSG
jgi:hypothetical protein